MIRLTVTQFILARAYLPRIGHYPQFPGACE
jgi:hypothetical protein